MIAELRSKLPRGVLFPTAPRIMDNSTSTSGDSGTSSGTQAPSPLSVSMFSTASFNDSLVTRTADNHNRGGGGGNGN